MKQTIQFQIFKSDGYYVAEGVGLPVVTQGKTLDEVAQNIREAVELHLEDENLEDFELVDKPQILASVEISSFAHAA